MTVIACKNGVIASDTSSWHGDLQRGSAQKIFRLDDGALFAAAGWRSVVEQAREWVNAGAPSETRPSPAAEGQLDAVILRRDRSIWYVDHRFVLCQSDSDFDVAGSHHEFLYGAMLAGASAQEAVLLAIRHCAKAAGDVQVMRL